MGVFAKDLTGRGEEDAFSAPLEKIDAKRVLEVTHLLRDIGLRNAQPIRRPAKATGLSHFEEVAEVPNFERVVCHFSRKGCSEIAGNTRDEPISAIFLLP